MVECGCGMVAVECGCRLWNDRPCFGRLQRAVVSLESTLATLESVEIHFSQNNAVQFR